MFNHEQNIMIDRIVKELEENNFAIFAGAGLSAPAGYVNWKEGRVKLEVRHKPPN